QARQRRQLGLGLLLVLAAIGLPILLSATGVVTIGAETIAGAFGWLLLATVVGFFGWLFLSASWTPAERRRLVVILVLFLGAAVFWAVFEQAGSTLNLFAERSTDATLLGMNFPTTWLLSLNSLFIIALAPAFAWLWVRLGRRDPPSPGKFAIGLLFGGLGFAILIVAARLASQGVKVSPLWLVATYFLHTLGELCLSPVGLSALTRLPPAGRARAVRGG